MRLEDLRTRAELVAKYPKVLTNHTLGWQMRHAEQNGLDRALVRVGRHVLINEPLYAEWLAERGRLGATGGAPR